MATDHRQLFGVTLVTLPFASYEDWSMMRTCAQKASEGGLVIFRASSDREPDEMSNMSAGYVRT